MPDGNSLAGGVAFSLNYICGAGDRRRADIPRVNDNHPTVGPEPGEVGVDGNPLRVPVLSLSYTCSATVRIRTSANELRSLVSRPWNGGVSSGRLGLHQRHRGCHPRALLLSYVQLVAVEGIEPNVRSRLTNGSTAGLAPKIIASP